MRYALPPRSCAGAPEVGPPVRELEPGTGVEQWSVSGNVHRRHLSTSQRGVVGARMGDADGVTLDDAVQFMNVSRVSVAGARAGSRRWAPEVLRAALLDGTVSVGDACKVRDLEPVRLDEAVAGV